MLTLIQNWANKSINPHFFFIGMGLIYITAFVLLLAVGLKFVEHAKNPQKLSKSKKHPFSTFEMTLCAAALFQFWISSYGQMSLDKTLQYIYFSIGFFMIIFGIIWHIWAKFNIGFLWSDGIEIKQEHSLVSSGAYGLARHPMYASLLMWCWGASLVMFNWITLALVSFIFLPLMIRRAKDEERELLTANSDYALYQQNVRMLFPTISGIGAVVIKVLAIALFGYYIWTGITLPSILLLFFIHLYLGYSLTPEKVAFSYRSKSGMMVVFWTLSLLWHPIYYLLYLALAMFIYGLKWNCPCMIVYNKYHRCPCFDLFNKCVLKNNKS